MRPSFVLLDPSQKVMVAERLTPLDSAMRIQEVIGPKGGWIGIKDVGLWVYVPRNAVSKRTIFSITAVPGNLVAYEFGPHGTRFNVPLDVFQLPGKHGVKIKDGEDPANLEAGYFPGLNQLLPSAGEAMVDEILPVTFDPQHGTFRFQVDHFSGYLLASGRHKNSNASNGANGGS
ncbi:MAG: hypothetical protein H7Z74_06200 [Anaerolineae bacterium]|nr:hypothetical protein [Gemmatimonadaceae bacterium]